jgi:hypothetical protein
MITVVTKNHKEQLQAVYTVPSLNADSFIALVESQCKERKITALIAKLDDFTVFFKIV